MTTTVVYHTFAMPFSMQRGRPLKFVVYHRVVLGVKKQHFSRLCTISDQETEQVYYNPGACTGCT